MGLRTVTVRVTGSGTSLLGRIAVVSVVTVSRISMSPRKAASAARTTQGWGMAEKPSQRWRADVADEESLIAEGRLDRDHAAFLGSYSEDFLQEVDSALSAFEADIVSLTSASDAQILGAVERVVVALNGVGENGGSIDTDEREQLCLFIDEVLTENGVDVGALAARHRLNRYAITDHWRRW